MDAMLRRSLTVLGALLCGLPACAQDAAGPESIAGEYALRTVDGQPLPFSFGSFGVIVESPPYVPVDTSAVDQGVEITDGRLILFLDGTYRDEMTETTTPGTETRAELTLTGFGGYVLNNDQVTFIPDRDGGSALGGTFTGTIDGDQLTANRGGYVLGYSR